MKSRGLQIRLQPRGQPMQMRARTLRPGAAFWGRGVSGRQNESTQLLSEAMARHILGVRTQSRALDGNKQSLLTMMPRVCWPLSLRTHG